MGGFGSAVLEFYANTGYHDVPVEIVAVADYFVEHGSVKEQRQEVGLTAQNLVDRVRAWMPVTKGVVEA
ncbi:1-deoxy-D-xylulose-5-phosphate synthase [Mycobacterium tuberculosis]|nr:1-deoxy-D-xylulose-5-phosphate synthase [Mycobacterium tuberculosis]